jgi:hypothetical protein
MQLTFLNFTFKNDYFKIYSRNIWRPSAQHRMKGTDLNRI